MGSPFYFQKFADMRSHSYINSATTILQQYDGTTPLALWLKQFFKSQKKYGSRDRKEIAHLCYSFYRLGNAFAEKTIEERMLIGVFLSSTAINFILQELRPEWNEKIQLSIDEKLAFLNASLAVNDLFPFAEELSATITRNAFSKSMLVQPLLYLRVRPGKEKTVITKLQKAGMNCEEVGNDCIALANSTKVDELIELNAEAVVQDVSSQKVLEIVPAENKKRKGLKVWDCCAASGGKSLLLYDQNPNIHLTVSDVRESILFNLKKRFEQASIKNYKSFVADLSVPTFKLPASNFDLIICDAPCSGSGTWSRTPEQLQFFKRDKVEYYATLQKAIAVNASQALKKRGYFLYITCSVFKKENEEVVDFIQTHTSLQLVTSHYLKGYDKKADTLFAALFEKPEE